MKKLLNFIICFTVVCCCLFCLTSCGKEEKIPGLYKDEYIQFNYPERWDSKYGTITVFTKPDGSNNNITVAYEAKNTYYDTLTIESYLAEMGPVYDQMGMRIINPSLAKSTNINGAYVISISYDVEAMVEEVKVTMQQTLYILTSGDRTYTVTFTERVNDDDKVTALYNSLKILK